MTPDAQGENRRAVAKPVKLGGRMGCASCFGLLRPADPSGALRSHVRCETCGAVAHEVHWPKRCPACGGPQAKRVTLPPPPPPAPLRMSAIPSKRTPVVTSISRRILWFVFLAGFGGYAFAPIVIMVAIALKPADWDEQRANEAQLHIREAQLREQMVEAEDREARIARALAEARQECEREREEVTRVIKGERLRNEAAIEKRRREFDEHAATETARLKAQQETLERMRNGIDALLPDGVGDRLLELEAMFAKAQAEAERAFSARDEALSRASIAEGDREKANRRAHVAEARSSQLLARSWSYRGALLLHNQCKTRVDYEMRWLCADGEWTDWKRGTVGREGSRLHQQEGALRCEVRFDGSGGNGDNHSSLIWLPFSMIPTDSGPARSLAVVCDFVYDDRAKRLVVRMH